MENQELTIGLEKLSAESTAALAVAFEQMAVVSRHAGDVGAESLLVGLAGLLDEHGRRLCAQTGEPQPPRLAITPAPAEAGVVNAASLSISQSLRVAHVLTETGREFDRRNSEPIAQFFAGLAQAVANVAEEKISAARGIKSGHESGSIH